MTVEFRRATTTVRCFRGLRAVWRRGEGFLSRGSEFLRIGRLMPAKLGGAVHPALLDAALVHCGRSVQVNDGERESGADLRAQLPTPLGRVEACRRRALVLCE